jgi:hypothetical protein
LHRPCFSGPVAFKAEAVERIIKEGVVHHGDTEVTEKNKERKITTKDTKEERF